MRKSRYPEKAPKGICRGCGSPVPKGRITWCSNDCYETLCPNRVIFNVRKRDKDTCQICKKQLSHRWIWSIEGETYEQQILRRKKWKTEDRPEYDHIIPFSEGGKTVLENMRTLCRKCHVERTSAWRKEKSQKGKIKQVELAL